MPNQHRYNTRSSAACGNPSQDRVDNHQHDPNSDHSSSARSSERSAVSSYTSSGQEVLHPYETQDHKGNNQDESKSHENPDPSPTRDNDHDESNSHDNPDPSPNRDNNDDESDSSDSLDSYFTRDNNQDLRPDANAPFGYGLNAFGKKYPAPDPNQIWLVRERNGAHTDKTRREIDTLSGHWSMTPNGTRYFQRTTPFEVS